jgi:hypothetical protein
LGLPEVATQHIGLRGGRLAVLEERQETGTALGAIAQLAPDFLE